MTVIDWVTLAKQSGSMDPLPIGTELDMIVVDAQPAQAQNGKPMIKTKMRVETGPHAGRSVWNNFTLSAENEDAMRFWWEHMAIFGMPQQWFIQTNPGIDTIAQNMLKKRCRITIEYRTWNGTQRAQVKTLKSPLQGSDIMPVGAVPDVSAAALALSLVPPLVTQPIPQMPIPRVPQPVVATMDPPIYTPSPPQVASQPSASTAPVVTSAAVPQPAEGAPVPPQPVLVPQQTFPTPPAPTETSQFIQTGVDANGQPVYTQVIAEEPTPATPQPVPPPQPSVDLPY